MKRPRQRSPQTRELPQTVTASRLADVRGGATMVEYALLFVPSTRSK
jgi:hypothetical protein